MPIRAALPDVLADLDVDEGVRVRHLAPLLPPGAALAHRSAAALHGIGLRMPHERGLAHPVEVVVPAGTAPVRRSGVRCFAADLAGDVVLVEGVPVTSLLRTVLDTARFAPPPLALAVLDLAARRGLFSPVQALLRLDAVPGQRGVARARRLVALTDPGAESPGESWLRLRLADAGFPRARTQIPVAGYRLDLGWPARRLAVEFDGREFHEGTRALAHDRRRREHLAERGWTVVGVGAGEVLGRSLHLELGVGELLGLAPQLRARRW